MATRDYCQIEWDADVEDDCRQLIRLAVREDLQRLYDWTTVSLVPEATLGRARIVARKPGIIAGLPAALVTLEEYDPQIRCQTVIADGEPVAAGQAIAEISGPARSLLAAERPLLNLLGHLAGIATYTRRFVEAVAGTRARIYDTRKTTLGWRRLEKYAVRAGGGYNHRLGLCDGILIKDNHLALGADASAGYSPAEAVRRAHRFLGQLGENDPHRHMLIEVEVDSLDQLRDVLPTEPDIVLLDNMPPDTLREAVALRDALAPAVDLEASGGINLATVAAVAASGVDRISVGALTHSAEWLDIGLDWLVD
ncbi:MAG TPA: carboxylating nicotinate-nucleotide diphosphorylase [Pirellulales bacterium]|nr:carboxylating nicotinate-nucleotide diphosphorylase [Pirellulales bacterium]